VSKEDFSNGIPIVDLPLQYKSISDEIRHALDEVLETQQFILGPAVRRFEEQMADYLRCRFAVGVASGSDALLLALMALGIGPGDSVIVPTFTFFSTVSSITRLGATPLIIDIDPQTYLMTPASVEVFLAEHCRPDGDGIIEASRRVRINAILPVHLFGQCCAMAEILGIAERYGLGIIEDAAQACGARISIAPGKTALAGAIGDLGCFSFFPSKTLGGFGDGGLVVTNRDNLAEKVRALRVHGASNKYYHQVTGINSRLDSIQAAGLSVKQRYLERWCEERIDCAERYHRLFQQSAILANGLVRIPPVITDKSHVFNSYVIRAERRDELKRYLADSGIQTEVYYPLPLHLQPCFAELGYRRGDFPYAEAAATQVLALPIYPELTQEQQERVVGKIRDFYRDQF
jgi:dTDP-4-amino-4,6-dideoxygalactose transaminase